jgi:hypothetical protein
VAEGVKTSPVNAFGTDLAVVLAMKKSSPGRKYQARGSRRFSALPSLIMPDFQIET